MKTNKNGETLVEHHVKYKELHGVDETIWMTRSEHSKLHKRLRDGGKCNIAPNMLNQISRTAYNRTDKMKEYLIKYNIKNIQSLLFYDRIGRNVRLQETIRYNMSTGNVGVYCTFIADQGHKLYLIGGAQND